MSSEWAIRVHNLSKTYRLYDRPSDRGKQWILPAVQKCLGREPAQYYREVHAVENVSFEVKKGETLGIIGRNGSGKSTLLQLIVGTLSPTGGTIEIDGRVAALLELGAGFHPEFTGRENVFLNASLLGLSRADIDAQLDDMLAFAEIGASIDQPVKTYSSGMVVRLAFAVMAHVKADILVIDEALAVGGCIFRSEVYPISQSLYGAGNGPLRESRFRCGAESLPEGALVGAWADCRYR
jgi:lipopolysaccharide transport system ATP-binding protein